MIRIVYQIAVSLFLSWPFLSANAMAEEAFLWLDDIDYAPYISHDEDHIPKGLFVDIITETFERIGVPLEINLHPWKRTQLLVKSKKGDGMLTVATRERRKYLYPSENVYTFITKLFTHQNNENLDQLLKADELSKLKIYRFITYVGNGWAQENLKEFKVRYVPTISAAVTSLVKQSPPVDAMIENDFIMQYNLKRLLETGVITNQEARNITANPKVFQEVEFKFLIRKDSKFTRIIPAFNQALQDMRDDGTYENIIAKYTYAGS